jgi:Ca2+-transporting ATPase
MYWSQNSQDLFRKFDSDPQSGLTHEKYSAARMKYGANSLTESKRISRLTIFFKQFQNLMTYLLLLAGGVSFFLKEHIDAMAIFAIVILNGVVGFIQEAKAEASIAALKKLSTPKAKVIRDGKVEVVESNDIVPGDLLSLEAGDYIVADAVVIHGYQLAADESILTGESMPVEKFEGNIPADAGLSERSNMLHSSTALTSGSGKALVVSTGMKTEIGKIAGLLEVTKSEETPLQKRLTKVSNKLLLLGLAVMIIAAILEYDKGRGWLDIFMLSISLAVAAIPEGLPTIVTLALALAVRRMSKRNAIVRKMSAVETLGSTDVICTDKTGTLTTGDMIVRNVFTFSPEERKELNVAAVACNNASLDNGGSGDPTEIALLRMAEGTPAGVRLHEWSFESDRKRMSVAIQDHDEIKIFCKGAPESVLPLCHLTGADKKLVDEKIKEFSSRGQRILALAFRTIMNFDPGSPPPTGEVEQDLKFLGIVSIADPPKEETVSSIAECRASGIKVIMITGDHPLTAQAIAKELGIIDQDNSGQVMTGSELDAMTSEDLSGHCENILVYARVSPEHKLKIIEALQKNGHTVAMTGDGVNDSPALKKASIGVAMGKAGTEVARQASSMILTDDNFATIVHAVEEGRAIFGNIKRTIQYLLSTNLAEILIVLGTSLSGLRMPFVPLGLLWINLVTDGFPSLALAAEPVDKDYLKKSEGPSPASFFDDRFMREIFLVAGLMTLIELVVYFYLLKTTDDATARSCAFHLLVYLSLFRSFSCRSETRTYFQLPFNKFHILSVIVPIIFQVLLGKNQSFRELFGIAALEISVHGLLMLFALIPVTIIETRKVLRSKTKNS